MKKLFVLWFILGGLVLAPVLVYAQGENPVDHLRGHILLQVEAHGEAWYVNPADTARYYLKDGNAAYTYMRALSLGISNSDLSLIPSLGDVTKVRTYQSVCSSHSTANRLKGKMLLQVESHGEAWYVDPDTCYRVYLKNGTEAYSVMRYLSLGITTENLESIFPRVGEVIDSSGIVSNTPVITAPETITEQSFIDGSLYNSGGARAATQVSTWQSSEPEKAALLTQIASQPVATWFGDWDKDIRVDVDKVVSGAAAAQKIPVLVAYAIPNRDCGSGYSSGGVTDAGTYHAWISAFAEGIGSRSAMVILEPDAVALNCFTDARGAMLADAVKTLEAKPGVNVYIDAGHPNWTPADDMADRLKKSGIAQATGFALNVSNFYKTDENILFGKAVSALVGGKHFVIDTSRNGNGWQGEWCNPQGAAIGQSPTLSTGEPLADGFLWVKLPGSSDGYCNGGPAAGAWWADYAVKLVQNVK